MSRSISKYWQDMRKPNTHRPAFSLVELVIVIVIMGILAAIAIPRLSRSARTSGAAALKGDLATMRNAIEMYAAEHGGKYPDANIAAQLTQFSDYAGTTFNATKNPGSGLVYGPYLKEIPPLPAGTRKGNSGIYASTGAAPPEGPGFNGWWYQINTHEIRANLTDGNQDDDGVSYNTY